MAAGSPRPRLSLDLQLADSDDLRRHLHPTHRHTHEHEHEPAQEGTHHHTAPAEASHVTPWPDGRSDTGGWSGPGGGGSYTGGGSRPGGGASNAGGGPPTGGGARRRRRHRASTSPPEWALVARDRLAEIVDVVVCLGGDGTLLWCASPRPLLFLGACSWGLGFVGLGLEARCSGALPIRYVLCGWVGGGPQCQHVLKDSASSRLESHGNLPPLPPHIPRSPLPSLGPRLSFRGPCRRCSPSQWGRSAF